MAWDTSTRSQRLPPDWPRRRRRTFRRDNWTCQHPGCTYHHPQGHGLECDHITPGDNHSLDNLQTLCHQHHMAKTIAERPKRKPRRRPTETHPSNLA